MTLNEQIAFAAGYNAAYHGEHRAPCLNSVVMHMISDGRKIGEGDSLEIFTAFSAGYQKQCDDEASELLSA